MITLILLRRGYARRRRWKAVRTSRMVFRLSMVPAGQSRCTSQKPRNCSVPTSPSIRCPQPVRMALPGPVLSRDWSEFRGTPIVAVDGSPSSWVPMIQFENAVRFSRTPDLETLSRSCSSEARVFHASEVAGSTRCSHPAAHLWNGSSLRAWQRTKREKAIPDRLAVTGLP